MVFSDIDDAEKLKLHTIFGSCIAVRMAGKLQDAAG